MNARERREPASEVQFAIEQLLTAERDGEAAIEAARAEADAMVTAASEHAAQIAARTRRRIAALRAACERRLQREVAVLGSRGPGTDSTAASPDAERLARIVELVAVRLVADEIDGAGR